MSTSKPPQPGSPQASGSTTGTSGPAAPNSYTRFIPREELGNFSAWNPTAFEQGPEANVPADVGLRKPTLAERAAADVASRKAQSQQQAELSKALRDAAEVMRGKSAPAGGGGVGSATGPGQAASAAAATAQNGARPAPARPANTTAAPQARPAAKRPIIGGVPGENPVPQEPVQAASEPAAAPVPNVDELLREARQTAYQEGYRNGLAALESYKQTQATQMAAYMSDQVGMLASDFHQRLEALEQQLAGRIAGVALELARQVVRADLTVHPETVVEVAEEALSALLTSARQVVLRLHPDDHAMAQAQLAEVLAARGVRLVSDLTLTRGGCIVESDIAIVDATVEARWDRAAASLGHRAPWNGGREAQGDTSVVSMAERLEAAEDAEFDAAHRAPTADAQPDDGELDA